MWALGLVRSRQWAPRVEPPLSSSDSVTYYGMQLAVAPVSERPLAPLMSQRDIKQAVR